MRLPLQALIHAQRLTEWALVWKMGAMRASERTAASRGNVCASWRMSGRRGVKERLPDNGAAYQTVWLAERTWHTRAKRRQDNTWGGQEPDGAGILTRSADLGLTSSLKTPRCVHGSKEKMRQTSMPQFFYHEHRGRMTWAGKCSVQIPALHLQFWADYFKPPGLHVINRD